MANSIAAALAYIKRLDTIYKNSAKSVALDVNPAWVRESDVAGTFYLPDIALVGLGNYSSTGGFPAGDATFKWTAYTYSQDRGREFTIDNVENAEAAGMAFGALMSEFIPKYEVPEVDAYRFAAIATAAGTDVAITLTDGDDRAAALNIAYNTLQENEVDDDSLLLFITPTWLNSVKNQVASTAVPCPVLDAATVVVVPQSRFYTAITVNAGSTGSVGGYARATGAEEINFILMDKGAAFADAKHQAIRIFSPDGSGGYPVWQTADQWAYQFRMVHDCWLFENKKAGVYVHTKDATTS